MAVAEEEQYKCSLLSEFYSQSKNNRELITEEGHLKVEYWRAARTYIEDQIRKSKEPKLDNPPWFESPQPR